jgi:hypothetical protein
VLVAPRIVVGKAIVAGVSKTAGALGFVPVPLSIAVCGEPLALSATERKALKGPAETGLNSTKTVQDEPAINVAPQFVADLMNELALAPVIVSEVSVKVAVPEFFTVTI